MGEEWRKGRHPNASREKSNDRVLIVGAGPAGSRQRVRLASAATKYIWPSRRGTRRPRHARARCRAAEWARVRDWRTGQIGKLQNIQVYKAIGSARRHHRVRRRKSRARDRLPLAARRLWPQQSSRNRWL
jgi:hypothetical protein